MLTRNLKRPEKPDGRLPYVLAPNLKTIIIYVYKHEFLTRVKQINSSLSNKKEPAKFGVLLSQHFINPKLLLYVKAYFTGLQYT